MKEGVSYLTPKQAAELLGVTARTMLNRITRGVVSATRVDGNYYIEKSEFYRVYPDAFSDEQHKESGGNEQKNYANSEKISSEMEKQYLRQALEESKKQIEFIKDQLLKFQEMTYREKDQMLQALNSNARLLEHHGSSKQKIIENDAAGKEKKKFLGIFGGK